MTSYGGRGNPECLRCKQVISLAAESLRKSCVQTIFGDYDKEDGCCWYKNYGMSFPTDACSFTENYEKILSNILNKDLNESFVSKNFWDKCIKEKIEAVKLCTNLGSCNEAPPGPKEHSSMVDWCNKHFATGNQTECWDCISNNVDCEYEELNGICLNIKDCRNDNLLSIINPPTGELKQCLDKFKNGDCCKKTLRTTAKGLNKVDKQNWWHEYSRTEKYPQKTPEPKKATKKARGVSSISEAQNLRELVQRGGIDTSNLGGGGEGGNGCGGWCPNDDCSPESFRDWWRDAAPIPRFGDGTWEYWFELIGSFGTRFHHYWGTSTCLWNFALDYNGNGVVDQDDLNFMIARVGSGNPYFPAGFVGID